MKIDNNDRRAASMVFTPSGVIYNSPLHSRLRHGLFASSDLMRRGCTARTPLGIDDKRLITGLLLYGGG